MREFKSAVIYGMPVIIVIAAIGWLVHGNLGSIEQQSAVSSDDAVERAKQNEEFMGAVSDGDLLVVKDYIEGGADINYVDRYGWTPLIQATMMNHFDVVKFLVIKGAKVDAVALDGTNPLQNAVTYDHVAMVKFLISQGADLNQVGKYGWNAVATAEHRNRKKVLNFLTHEGLLTH